MPLQRIGEGLIVVGVVFVAAMVALGIISNREVNSPSVTTGIFSLATVTIGGIIKLLAKLEEIAQITRENQSHNEVIRTKVDKCDRSLTEVCQQIQCAAASDTVLSTPPASLPVLPLPREGNKT